MALNTAAARVGDQLRKNDVTHDERLITEGLQKIDTRNATIRKTTACIKAIVIKAPAR